MDAKLAEAIGSYKDYFEVQEDGKIKCLVNGHCFPANRPEQIAAFVNGARFLKLKVRYDAEVALVKYEPFIVVSKNFPHMLYCALTGQLLEKSVAAVKKHMGGKRFVKAKARFVADQQDLKPEPSLREFGIILPGEEGGDDGVGGRKAKKQRKAKAAAVDGDGDGDAEMEEADGESEEEEEEEEEDSEGEPAFWMPPNERGRSSRKGGRKTEEDGEEEMEMDEAERASSEDAMATDEDGNDAQPAISSRARAAAGGAHENGAGQPGGNGTQRGARHQQLQQKKPAAQQEQRRQQNQKQAQKGPKGQGPNKGEKQRWDAKPTADNEQQQAGGGKNGKLSKKQRKKAAAAAPQPDDFDFDMDAHGAGGDDAEAQPVGTLDQSGAVAGAAKPKNKNVNRPASAKKARKE